MSIGINQTQVAAFQSFWSAQDRMGVLTSSEARGVDSFRTQGMQDQVAFQAAETMLSSIGDWASDTFGSLFGNAETPRQAPVAPEAAAATTAPSRQSGAIDQLRQTGDGLLGSGSSGPEVKALQEMLQSAGYDLGTAGVDGQFGPTTKAAAEAFQRDQAEKNPDSDALAVDGIVGAQTRAALGNDALAKAATQDRVDSVMDNHVERNAAPAAGQAKADSVTDNKAEQNAAPAGGSSSADRAQEADSKAGGEAASGGTSV